MDLDHVAVVVDDIEGAIKMYESLGLKLLDREEIEEEGVRIAFLSAGASKIEILQPTKDNGVKKFLDSRGGGMHHIAFKTKSVSESMNALKGDFKFTTDEPKMRYGRNVCFIHPKSAKGVLIEFVE